MGHPIHRTPAKSKRENPKSAQCHIIFLEQLQKLERMRELITVSSLLAICAVVMTVPVAFNSLFNHLSHRVN